MNSYILGLATETPEFHISQSDALKQNLSLFPLNSQQEKQIISLYENSGIQKRHTVYSDFLHDRSKWDFWGSSYPNNPPGMAKRNDLYKKEAPKLALRAAENALKNWGGDRSSITHILSISCTGVIVPSIEFMLMEELGLNRSVNRVGINFMGCFGAFKGIDVATAYALSNSKNRILVVCTELCSLHLQSKIDEDNLLANSIFADGAAAIVVGGNPRKDENPLWQIAQQTSYGLNNSKELMSWEAGDHGYLMKLSGFVPLTIAKQIKMFVEKLLNKKIEISDADWPIHPGGKAILHLIEKQLKLNKDQTQAAWETLANYGNMSSATFLFVLDALQKQKKKRDWAVGIGFGPGLSFEGILLKTQ